MAIVIFVTASVFVVVRAADLWGYEFSPVFGIIYAVSCLSCIAILINRPNLWECSAVILILSKLSSIPLGAAICSGSKKLTYPEFVWNIRRDKRRSYPKVTMKYDFSVFQEPRGVMRIFQFVSEKLRKNLSFCMVDSIFNIDLFPDIRRIRTVHHRQLQHRRENADQWYHVTLLLWVPIPIWQNRVQHQPNGAIFHIGWCISWRSILCGHSRFIDFVLCIHLSHLLCHRWSLHIEAGDSAGRKCYSFLWLLIFEWIHQHQFPNCSFCRISCWRLFWRFSGLPQLLPGRMERAV